VNKRLYVGNLEYSTTDKELEELFSSEGNVVYSKIITRADGKSRGFGFVEMETEEEAKNAMEKFNQSSFKERTLVVNEARQNENRRFSNRDYKQNYNRDSQQDLNSKLKKLKRKFN
jgi:RNA recognition motif-containing protein